MLSGTKEAELAALGVVSGIHAADGFAGDLGGGSLELIDVRGGRLSDAATLPLGGLRLIDASGGSLKKARDIVDAELAKVDWLEKGRGRDFYAIGGTWRALARLHMTQTNYPLSVMHNYRINCRRRAQIRRSARSPIAKLARRHPRHLERPARDHSLWRARARAADQADEAALRGGFGVRHPRGSALQPAQRGGEAQGPADRRLRRHRAADARARSTAPTSCASGPMRCSGRRVRPRRRSRGGFATRPACSPISAGARIPTIAACRA